MYRHSKISEKPASSDVKSAHPHSSDASNASCEAAEEDIRSLRNAVLAEIYAQLCLQYGQPRIQTKGAEGLSAYHMATAPPTARHGSIGSGLPTRYEPTQNGALRTERSHSTALGHLQPNHPHPAPQLDPRRQPPHTPTYSSPPPSYSPTSPPSPRPHPPISPPPSTTSPNLPQSTPEPQHSDLLRACIAQLEQARRDVEAANRRAEAAVADARRLKMQYGVRDDVRSGDGGAAVGGGGGGPRPRAQELRRRDWRAGGASTSASPGPVAAKRPAAARLRAIRECDNWRAAAAAGAGAGGRAGRGPEDRAGCLD